ncbi:MAG: SIMPL domain-containing protein [Terriglobales bacterium]
MRKATLITAVMWATVSLAAAQMMAPKEPAVTVSAQGEFKAAPDTAVVAMEIQGRNVELKAAYAAAQAQAEKLRTLLRQQGFSPEDAAWDSYRVQPNIDYKTDKVIDYTVAVNLELRFKDFHRLGPLLDAATGQGLNVVRGVSFSLSDTEAAKARAIADGYGRALREAKALAAATGMKLGELQSATVDSVNLPTPMPRYMIAEAAMAKAPTAEFTPSQITITAVVHAVYKLQ